MRAPRQTSGVLTAVSVLLCLAALGLWAWSYVTAAALKDGRLLVIHTRGPDSDGWQLRKALWQFPTLEVYDVLLSRSASPRQHLGWQYVTGASPGHNRYTVAPQRDYDYYDYTWTLLAIPLWPLIVLFAVPPAVRLAAAGCRGRRAAAGRCVSCDYDLRATRGRCPECGTVPKQA